MLPIPPRDLPWLMLRVGLQAGFYRLHLEGSKTRRLQGAFESWSLEFGFLSSNHARAQSGPEAWTPGTVKPCESPGRGRGFTWERIKVPCGGSLGRDAYGRRPLDPDRSADDSGKHLGSDIGGCQHGARHRLPGRCERRDFGRPHRGILDPGGLDPPSRLRHVRV